MSKTSINLSKYLGKYVALTLASSQEFFGRLEEKADVFFLEDGYLSRDSYDNDGIYLAMHAKNESFRTYEIAPEHITTIRDIDKRTREIRGNREYWRKKIYY